MSKPIVIKFYPDVDVNNLPCMVNYISWQRLHEHLEQAVALRPNERLAAITVTELGVKAHIDTFNPQPHE